MTNKHAEHNERACDFLLESGEFNDWVVTTAFYSALHHANHEMFPTSIKGKDFETFNDYCVYVKHITGKNPDKHKLTLELVGELMLGASPAYRWLYNKCMTARYSNYQVAPEFAAEAKKNLGIFKRYLRKK